MSQGTAIQCFHSNKKEITPSCTQQRTVLLSSCKTSAQLASSLIPKLPVTVSLLFGLKQFLLFKSTRRKTNTAFNWSIIVSQREMEVECGGWGWEDGYGITMMVMRFMMIRWYPPNYKHRDSSSHITVPPNYLPPKPKKKNLNLPTTVLLPFFSLSIEISGENAVPQVIIS